MVAAAVMAGLEAVGRDTLNGGIAATPTTGIVVRDQGAAGGIQVTASHNPPEYNGLKLFAPEGRVLTAAAGEKVVATYRAGSAPEWVGYAALGQQQTLEDVHRVHLDQVLATVDVETIRKRKFRVVVDSNHGSGSQLARPLLEALGCDVTILGEEADGNFTHTPEPTEANLVDVAAQAAGMQADVCFCQDPDADRLAVIDEAGRYLGEELTLAVCVDHVLSAQNGPVVTNCSTSRMSEDLAERHGVPFHRSAVGEANVVDVMLREGAVLGGEGNGGVIDPRVGLVRDSFVGMALWLDAMAARGAPVSQLAATMPRYAIAKTKVSLAAEKVATGLEALAEHFRDATADRMDGLRLDWPGRWLLVRASNTEPVVRIIAEAEDAETAEGLCRDAGEVLAKV